MFQETKFWKDGFCFGQMVRAGGRGGGGGEVDTYIVGIVIFIVGQLDHAIGALDKGRCP